MRIDFKKIGSKKRSFSVEKEGVVFSGEYKRENELVDIRGRLENGLSVECARCGREFMIKLDEKIHLKANDGIFRGSIDGFDVVEFFEGFVDFEELLGGEIESIRLDYHLCPECTDGEEFSYEI